MMCSRCCDLERRSGNHFREPPCILVQASAGIPGHRFRSSRRYMSSGTWCDSHPGFALQARGHWFDPSCAHPGQRPYRRKSKINFGACRATLPRWQPFGEGAAKTASPSSMRTVRSAGTRGISGTVRAAGEGRSAWASTRMASGAETLASVTRAGISQLSQLADPCPRH